MLSIVDIYTTCMHIVEPPYFLVWLYSCFTELVATVGLGIPRDSHLDQ